MLHDLSIIELRSHALKWKKRMNAESFFENLWQDYIKITPQAEQIKQLFLRQENEVINDHVAFRTFSDCPINLQVLSDVIKSLGYDFQDEYDFSAKKLKAISFIHPDPRVPKIFISELERHKLSQSAQQILEKYVSQISVNNAEPAIFWAGRLWDTPTLEEYQALLDESEYAAWLLTIGIRVNHFTVSINHLTAMQDIEQVLDLVEEQGFKINQSGGRVKGTPETLLEQGSTMADVIDYTFSCGNAQTIASCFYEFAKRYPMSNGDNYQGFVAANADKIFESTSVR